MTLLLILNILTPHFSVCIVNFEQLNAFRRLSAKSIGIKHIKTSQISPTMQQFKRTSKPGTNRLAQSFLHLLQHIQVATRSSSPWQVKGRFIKIKREKGRKKKNLQEKIISENKTIIQSSNLVIDISFQITANQKIIKTKRSPPPLLPPFGLRMRIPCFRPLIKCSQPTNPPILQLSQAPRPK